jgi:hypothetical protein
VVAWIPNKMMATCLRYLLYSIQRSFSPKRIIDWHLFKPILSKSMMIELDWRRLFLQSNWWHSEFGCWLAKWRRDGCAFTYFLQSFITIQAKMNPSIN